MKSKKRSERGQISIMVAIMISTFVLLLAFVINTGMLVNAKINLQNAADVAAYAGAASQGRQLTTISYLNYEMRRQWKKLLFRIYVLGNMAQDGFPRGSGKTGPMQYIPNSSQGTSLGIPATCITLNKNDNTCRNLQLPRISIPPSSLLDSITETLRGQLIQIEALRQKNCQVLGQSNKMLNIYWIFNTDPTLANLSAGMGGLSQSQADVMNILRALATGLGIVPREVILKARIQTLAQYVNAPPRTGLNYTTVQALKQAQDPLMNERSIEAFLSAYYSLGNHTFPADSIVLDELVPTAGQNSANLISLKDIRTDFDTYSIDWDLDPSGNCVAKIVPVAVRNPVPVGVYKDPKVLTYYAVRLKAKAKVLFSPFGDLDLKAYAVAQPFGSRIGPKDQDVQFTTEAEGNRIANQFQYQGAIPNMTDKYPNLPVKESDSAVKGSGWDTFDVLGAMYGQFISLAGGNLTAIYPDMVERSYQSAMSPNPWEIIRYNIANDTADSFGHVFTTQGFATLWAPIFSATSQSSGSIETLISSVIDGTETVGHLGLDQPTTDAALQSIKNSLKTGISNYISNSLMNGRGENGETFNTVIIQNPFRMVNPNSAAGPVPIGGDPLVFQAENASKIRTSWNYVNDQAIRAEGRVGYSVKFISFDSLASGRIVTDGTNTMSNIFSDSEAFQDISNILH